MKTLRVGDIYPAGYETFSDVAERLPTFIGQPTIPGVSTRRLAIARQ
jgi:precorrin-2 methylase